MNFITLLLTGGVHLVEMVYFQGIQDFCVVLLDVSSLSRLSLLIANQWFQLSCVSPILIRRLYPNRLEALYYISVCTSHCTSKEVQFQL